LDSRIIAETTGAKLTLGKVIKDPLNPLFTEDKSWEPRFDDVYANVIYNQEDRLYKCLYNPFVVDRRVTVTPWISSIPTAPATQQLPLLTAKWDFAMWYQLGKT